MGVPSAPRRGARSARSTPPRRTALYSADRFGLTPALSMLYRENMNTEATTKRLCRIAAKITPSAWRFAEMWYPREGAWCEGAAEAHGYEGYRGCYVFAALSPRMQYGAHRKAMLALLRGETIGGLCRSRNAAIAALHLGKLPSGPKVSNFAKALAGDESAVAVDIWMMRAAGLTSDSPTKREYAHVALATTRAAKRCGVSPRTMQAAVWFQVRGSKPSDPQRPEGEN